MDWYNGPSFRYWMYQDKVRSALTVFFKTCSFQRSDDLGRWQYGNIAHLRDIGEIDGHCSLVTLPLDRN